MKIKGRLIVLFLCVELSLLSFCFNQPQSDHQLDQTEVNDIVYTIQKNWTTITKHKTLPEMDTHLQYTIMDNQGAYIASTHDTITKDLNTAITHRDTIVDILVDQNFVGKIIIYNEQIANKSMMDLRVIILIIASLLIQCLFFIFYYRYIYKNMIHPFENLKHFASKVANGDLDYPLKMDRTNTFGAFTESFDLMREELRKARINEAKANKSKKELVAKLSHDIKTPVASIKAVSELMMVKTKEDKMIQQLNTIQSKADQIDLLISNLFQATLEELQELTVFVQEQSSTSLLGLLKEADYLDKATLHEIPACLIRYDSLRLQQVFDNVIGNSYKYANTPIDIDFKIVDHNLSIKIKDYGDGVEEKDLVLILEKFNRGQNAEGKSGAGLGLYISKYLLLQMGGSIHCENWSDGFEVEILLSLI